VPTTQEERQNVVIIEVVVNHGEDQDEEDVEVVFIGAKNP
jgi:intracellular sulfur oxidation DsrE/DsrF family protein